MDLTTLLFTLCFVLSLTHLSFFSPSLFPVAFLCRRMFFLPKTRNEREIKRKEKKRNGLWGNLPIQIFFYFHLTVFGGKEKEKNKKKIKNNQKKSTKKPPLVRGTRIFFRGANNNVFVKTYCKRFKDLHATQKNQ